MVSWHGYIFRTLEQCWRNMRRFAFYNRTIFEIFCILLYALEQVYLIWFTFNAKNLLDLGFIVSIFAVIVLSTFALHKLLMESRIKFLEEKVQDLQLDKSSLEESTKNIKNEFTNLFDDFLSQDLNISKTLNKKERKNE